MTQAKREHEKSWYIHDWFETLQGRLVEDERQIFYKVEVLVSSVVFKMMTSCQLAF